MTYLLIALGVLREIAARESRCFMAMTAAVFALVLTTRLRLARAVQSLSRRGTADAADRRVTASVR